MEMKASKPEHRGPDGTREAILRASRALFSEHGYGQVGLRQIARVAGVDAALIIRYFGSKRRLLEDVLDGAFIADPALFEGPREGLGHVLATYLMSKDGGAAFDPVLVMMRSVGSEEAAAALYDSFEHQFVRPLAVWLGGRDAHLRANQIACELVGVVFMHNVLRGGGLSPEDKVRFTARLAASLQAVIDDQAA